MFLDVVSGTCISTCSVTTYVLNNTCLSSCPSVGYYPSENPKFCNACPKGCYTCTSNTTCPSCIQPFYSYLSTCVQTCPTKNFYANNTGYFCGSCDPKCLECSGNTLASCSVCISGLVYVNSNGVGSCVSSCSGNTYQNNTMCLNCMSSCSSCYNGYSCSSCSSGKFLRVDSTCGSSCGSGDIANLQNNTCIPYSSLYPTGQINLVSFSIIQITYPIPVSVGTGNLTIYSVLNGSYSLQQTFIVMIGPSISLGNAIGTSISQTTFNYGTSYSIGFSSGAVSSNYGVNLEIPIGVWNFSINPYQLQNLVVILNNGSLGSEVKQNSNFTLDASLSYDPSATYQSSVYSTM